MKKLYLILILLFVLQKSFAQTNTFPTSGSAGIGTTNPSYPLDIHGHTQRIYNATGAAYLRIEGTGLASYTGSYIYLSSANTRAGDTFNKARIDINRGADSTANFQISRMNGDTYTGIFYRYDDPNGHRFFTAASRTATTTSEIMRISPEGHVGIGTTLLANRGLGLSTPITGGTTAYGMLNNGTVKSDVTGGAYLNYSQLNTESGATFTLPVISHFTAAQGTVNSGTTITHQMGYWASSNLTNAANNYGFRGSLPAATGRWNLFMDGTADNYFAGYVGIGTSTPTLRLEVVDANGIAFRHSQAANTAGTFRLMSGAYSGNKMTGVVFSTTNTLNNIALGGGTLLGEPANNLYFYTGAGVGTAALGTNRMSIDSVGFVGIPGATRGFSFQVNRAMSPIASGTTAVGIISAGPIQAAGLTSTRYFQSTATVGAGAATGQVLHFYAAQGAFSSTATEQTGFNAGTTLVGATNNYGFRGQINASTGRWNLYMDGSANNYLNGNLGIGFTTPTEKLVVQGNAVFRGDSTGAKFSNDTYGGGRVYLAMDGTASNGIGAGGDYLLVERYTNSDAFIRNSGSLALVTTGAKDITLTANGNSTTFKSNGQIDIGTTTIPTDYKMAIAGNVIAEKVKVKKQSSGWPDYVFSPEYKLTSLEEVEQFTKKNSHLPEIPSAKEIEKEGQDLGDMNRLLLKKVEELTLYMIEQNKNMIQQSNEIKALKLKVDQLEKK